MGLAVGLISVLLLLWDFLTYPFYLIWDRPWRETRSQRIYLCTKRFMILCRLIERTRARIVDRKPDEVTIEPLPIESKMKVFQPQVLSSHQFFAGKASKRTRENQHDGEAFQILEQDILGQEMLGHKTNSWGT